MRSGLSSIELAKAALLGVMMPGFLHHWNNLLCGARTNLQLALVDASLDKELKETLEDSDECLSTCIKRMKSVLDFSRVGGKTVPHFASAALVCNHTQELLEYLLKHNRVTLTTSMPEEMGDFSIPMYESTHLILQVILGLYGFIKPGSSLCLVFKPKHEAVEAYIKVETSADRMVDPEHQQLCKEIAHTMGGAVKWQKTDSAFIECTCILPVQDTREEGSKSHEQYFSR